mgnify:CR=1 FL=1
MNFNTACITDETAPYFDVFNNYEIISDAKNCQISTFRESTKEILFSFCFVTELVVDSSKDKEHLYLTALKNLFRKLDFYDLYSSFENGSISEEEYLKLLNTNEDKYFIPSPVKNPTYRQLVQINDIIKKIGRKDLMSVDEVSELFSLDLRKAKSIIEKKQKSIKKIYGRVL